MDNSTLINNHNIVNKFSYLIPSIETCVVLGVGILFGWRLHKSRPDFLSRLTLDYKLTLIVPDNVATLSKKAILNNCTSSSILAHKNSAKASKLENFLWTLTGQRKIVVKANNHKDFEWIRMRAREKNVCYSLSKDSFNNSVIALGPAPGKILDTITGKLKLY